LPTLTGEKIMTITWKDAAHIIIWDLEGGDELITDSGGLTKFGVSQKAYPNLDIENLPYEDAEEIFHNDYWEPSKADQLPSPLNIYVVDAAYNMGVRTSMKLLQRALGNVVVDGRWGPRTQTAVTRCDPEILSRWFNQQRLRYYIGVRDFDKYGAGWFNRVMKLIDIVNISTWNRGPA
jgi:lysozyme family protein